MEKKEMNNWSNFTRICNTRTPLSNGSHQLQAGNTAIENPIQLVDNSPRDLMSTLQQQSSSLEAWQLRTKDLAVQEIIRERRAAIDSGKLKGRRRLFQAMEVESEIGFLERERIIFNGFNPDMGQDSEERFLSFYYSEDESTESKGLPDITRCSSSSSEVKEEEDACNRVATVAETRVGSNGGRYIVFLGVLAIALVIFALYTSWARNFEGYEVIPVPT